MKIFRIVIASVLCAAMFLALAIMPVYITPVAPSSPEDSQEELPCETVEVGGNEYSRSATTIDLSGKDFPSVMQLISELSAFDNLQEVTLYNSELSNTQKQRLVKKLPNVQFNWMVEIDGVFYDSKTTTEINFKRKNLAARNDINLFDCFGLFRKLEKVDMCGCGFSNAQMEDFMNAFPDVKFVWEVKLSRYWTLRTDAVAFSTLQGYSMSHRLTSEEARPLKYCTDLVALDLGHNSVLDLSFLQYMPNLKVLILVDEMEGIINGEWRYIRDLSMLKYCPKLMYLEYFCNQVTDLSFLQYLPNLVDLNISWSPVSDYTYLKNLPKIERLYMMGTSIPHEHFLELQRIYPNARIERYGSSSIDKGWRGHARFYAMRYMFLNNKIHPLFE